MLFLHLQRLTPSLLLNIKLDNDQSSLAIALSVLTSDLTAAALLAVLGIKSKTDSFTVLVFSALSRVFGRFVMFMCLRSGAESRFAVHVSHGL